MATQNNSLVATDFFFDLGPIRENSFIGGCMNASLFNHLLPAVEIFLKNCFVPSDMTILFYEPRDSAFASLRFQSFVSNVIF